MGAELPLKPPRRRKWLKRFVAVLFVLALLAFFAPAIIASTGLLQVMVTKSTMDIDGSVRVGGASLGWLKPVELTDVTLSDAEGRVIATLPRVTTSKSLFGFVRDHADLGSVTVERPAIAIVCARNSTNLEAALAKMLNAPKNETAAKPKLELIVTDATVTVIDSDQKQEWTFDRVNATASLPGTTAESLKATLSASTAGQDLNAEIIIGSTLTAKLTAKQFPLAAAGPFLRRIEPGLVLDGALTSDIDTATTSDLTTVKGTIAITNVVAASPRFGEEKLILKSIALPCNLESKGTRLTVKEMNLTCDLGTASFAGTFDTNDDMDKLLQTPDVNASADLNVAKVMAMFPKRIHLLPGTAITAGNLRITLASVVAANRTRWNGSVTTGALQGTRDGRVIIWDQPVQAAFQARFDAKLAPAFDTLTVKSDFATVEAKGQLEDFTARGEVSLDRLAARLRDFIDLNGVMLAGAAGFDIRSQPAADATAITGSVTMTNLACRTADYDIAGHGTLNAGGRFDARNIKATAVQGNLQAVRFRGFGVDVNEPIVRILPTDVTYDRVTHRIDVPLLQMATQTFSLGAQNIVFESSAAKTVITAKAAVKADLGRLQKMFGLQLDPKQSDAIQGLVTDASIEFKTEGGPIAFDMTLPVTNLTYGPPLNPTWREPGFTLKMKGEIDIVGDAMRLASASVERPDGQGISAAGSIGELSTRQTLDISGKLNYDLAKLEPQLKEMLGAKFKAAGKESRDYKLTGALSDKNSLALNLLDGSGSLAWQSLVAYGFDVGAASLNVKLDDGIVTSNPVTAKFGESGTVKVQPTLRLTPGTYDLTFQKGRIIDKAKLTPQATADAIGFALPAIAKSTQAEGTISFDLDDHRLLLTDIDKSTVKGRLTLHNVSVTAGPVITEVAGLFGQKQPKLTLANEQVVGIRMENGRVYHENLKLTFNGYTITTSGSVGVDGTLQLSVVVPLPESAVGPLLKNVPKLKEAIVNKTIAVLIGGTLEKPAVDNKAFQMAIKQFTDEALKSAAKGKVDELLNQGLEKLLPKPKKP